MHDRSHQQAGRRDDKHQLAGHLLLGAAEETTASGGLCTCRDAALQIVPQYGNSTSASGLLL